MINDGTVRIGEEIRRLFAENKPFRPFTAYFKHLDRILVLVKDCSIFEERVNDILTILEDNYPEKEKDKYVGFVIECARDFCLKCGLSSQRGTVRLAIVLDAIVAIYPKDVFWVDGVTRPLLKKFSLDSVAIS